MKLETRDATLTVNALDDDVLSSVGDVAIVEVAGLKNVSLYLNRRSDKAILNLATVTVNVDTVVIAATAGELPTISFTAGAAAGAGTIVEDLNAKTVAITFKTAVTTVTQIEALLATSVLLNILTPGTGANVLVIVDDDFAATPLAMNAATFTLTVEKSNDGTNFAAHTTVTQAAMPNGTSVAKEVTLSAANGVSLTAKQLKVTLSAMTGGAAFSAVAAGVPA